VSHSRTLARRTRVTLLFVLAGVFAGALAQPALAAKSSFCLNGGFRVLNSAGAPLATTSATIPAASLGDRFTVQGRYVQFDVVADSLGVLNWTFTGAPNPGDITGGVRTVVFASKTPDFGGLSSPLSVAIDGEGITLSRSGAAGSNKIQALDCAQGGIFQMEPERAGGGTTVLTHVTGPGVFYFNNPFFTALAGQVLNGVTVAPRVNFANDTSPKFVGRDSPQSATRLTQFGNVTTWSVLSGGRLGQVMGEDATEVAPPAVPCTHKCQAQDQVRGAFAVLGFPFPVPAEDRIAPAP
jgi:hypothetical protein